MKFKMYALIITGLTVCSLSFFGISQRVNAATTDDVNKLNQQISDKQKLVDELNASIEEYKKMINEKQAEANVLKTVVSTLSNKISLKQLEINSTQNTLDSLNLQLQSLRLMIDDKGKNIDRQKQIISELLRNIQANDQINYLKVAASYNNFSDFYNKVQSIQSVDKQLGQSVRTLRLTKEDLQNKQQQVEETKKKAEEIRTKLQNERQDLAEQENFQQALLKETKSKQSVYSTQLANLRKQAQQLDVEISAIEKEVRQQLEQDKKIKENVSAGVMIWPVSGRYVTATFHDPEYPYRNVFEHTGMDIRASHGTPIRAALSGYVAKAKRCSTSACYSYIMLVHNGGIATIYGHLSRILVSEGDFITQGDVIGSSGGTPGTVGAGPFVTGPHLHFEVRVGGIPVNPAKYLGN